MRRMPLALLALATFSAVTLTDAVSSAQAQSCGDLWYRRNAIYARNGFCFRTARAQATFGPGCFPPYGRLSGYEQQEVNALQYQERVRGCPQ